MAIPIVKRSIRFPVLACPLPFAVVGCVGVLEIVGARIVRNEGRRIEKIWLRCEWLKLFLFFLERVRRFLLDEELQISWPQQSQRLAFGLSFIDRGYFQSRKKTESFFRLQLT